MLTQYSHSQINIAGFFATSKPSAPEEVHEEVISSEQVNIMKNIMEKQVKLPQIVADTEDEMDGLPADTMRFLTKFELLLSDTECTERNIGYFWVSNFGHFWASNFTIGLKYNWV